MQTLWIHAQDIESRAAALFCDGALMVMPYTDQAMAQRSVDLAVSRAGVTPTSLLLAVDDVGREGFVSVLNRVHRHSSSAWLGYMAQDAYAGRDWLSLALARMASDRAGLLAFNDGKWHGQLASFGLADRSWVRGVYDGDFFFPGYHSHYADVELTLIARQQQRLAYEPNSVLVEVDWDKDRTGVNAADRSLFKTRVRQGMGGRVSDATLLGLFA